MKRVLLLGDKRTGKTTFLNIFLNKQISNEYDQTLGIQAAAKTVQFKDKSFVNLQIWDTPGQPQYIQLAFPFYQNCKFFILFVDRSNKQTLNTFPNWLEKIYDNSLNKAANILVVLNKTEQNEKFGQEDIKRQFQQATKQSPYQLFNITFKEIDITKQRQSLENSYIKPYLYSYCKDQIVFEISNQGKDKGISSEQCAPNGCLLM